MMRARVTGKEDLISRKSQEIKVNEEENIVKLINFENKASLRLRIPRFFSQYSPFLL